jgi:hypothetical protein
LAAVSPPALSAAGSRCSPDCARSTPIALPARGLDGRRRERDGRCQQRAVGHLFLPPSSDARRRSRCQRSCASSPPWHRDAVSDDIRRCSRFGVSCSSTTRTTTPPSSDLAVQ